MRVATMSTVATELQRRKAHNSSVRALLEQNPQWCAGSGPLQQERLTAAISAGAKEELMQWSRQLCRAAELDVSTGTSEAAAERLPAREEVCAGIAALESEALGGVHAERFHATPWPLFREIAQAVLDRMPRDRAHADWARRRLGRAAVEDVAARPEEEPAAAAPEGRGCGFGSAARRP